MYEFLPVQTLSAASQYLLLFAGRVQAQKFSDSEESYESVRALVLDSESDAAQEFAEESAALLFAAQVESVDAVDSVESVEFDESESAAYFFAVSQLFLPES